MWGLALFGAWSVSLPATPTSLPLALRLAAAATGCQGGVRGDTTTQARVPPPFEGESAPTPGAPAAVPGATLHVHLRHQPSRGLPRPALAPVVPVSGAQAFGRGDIGLASPGPFATELGGPRCAQMCGR